VLPFYGKRISNYPILFRVLLPPAPLFIINRGLETIPPEVIVLAIQMLFAIPVYIFTRNYSILVTPTDDTFGLFVFCHTSTTKV
jgi:hypothetical protein